MTAIIMVLMIVRLLTLLQDAYGTVVHATAETHLNVRFIAQMGMVGMVDQHHVQIPNLI